MKMLTPAPCFLLLACFLPAAASGADAGAPGGVAGFRQTIGEDSWGRLRTRLMAVNRDIAQKGILPLPGGTVPLLTGYAYHEFYDWDLYFENLYLSGYGISDYCFTNLQVFLSRQRPDGFVSRTLLRPRPTQMFKPFLAQVAVLGSRQRGDDFEWLRAADYAALGRYLDRWFAYDADGNGLPVWDSADASGMDNQVSRAGALHTFQDEGVDLACYLHRELEAMALIAGKLGKTDDQRNFQARADALARKINAVFWDEQDGFYYDRNEKTGQLTRVKTVTGFTPLWAGIASPEQARRLVQEHLTNPKEFWLKYPVATYAASEPDYYQGRRTVECNWRGPAWVPTNYMIFHGLLRYGYQAVARELAYRTFRMALDENPATREFYDSDTGKGNGMNPFWGWSALAYVMPLEYETGADPTDLNREIKPLAGVALDLPGPRPGAPAP